MAIGIRYIASKYGEAMPSKVNAGRKSKRKKTSSHSLSIWAAHQPSGAYGYVSATSAILAPAVGTLLLETPFFFFFFLVQLIQGRLKSKKGSVFYGLLYLWISKQMVTCQDFLGNR